MTAFMYLLCDIGEVTQSLTCKRFSFALLGVINVILLCIFGDDLTETELEEEVAALLKAAGAATTKASQEAEEKLAMKVWCS